MNSKISVNFLPNRRKKAIYKKLSIISGILLILQMSFGSLFFIAFPITAIAEDDQEDKCEPICKLEITKTDEKDFLNQGEETTYTIHVENVGDVICGEQIDPTGENCNAEQTPESCGVVVEDFYYNTGDILSYVSSSPEEPYEQMTNYMRWNLGQLNPGDTADIEVTMQVLENAECGFPIYNKARYWESNLGWGAYVIDEATVKCGAICGDGIVEGDEECDDGPNGSETCTSECETRTVVKAYKVVCEAEEYLPDWGWAENPSKPEIISSTTAQDFVNANSEHCWLESGWEFQWGYRNSLGVKPEQISSDHIGPADGSGGEGTYTGSSFNEWKNFSSVTGESGEPAVAYINDLEASDEIWVRENLQVGYIPFARPPVENNQDSNSAEIYCYNDILNFDNYDWIKYMEYGEIYNCVAFNAQIRDPYCGDGVENQEWEECDGDDVPQGEICDERCQIVDDECSDRVFARVNVNKEDVQNWGDGNMTSNIYLGSNTYNIPSGVWFLLSEGGVAVNDPDVSGYEDVPGLAVQRLEGQVRAVMHGSNGTEDIEHIDGNIEFYNASVENLLNDTSNNNRLEGEDPFNITAEGSKAIAPGDDEVWLVDGDIEHSYFWMTTDIADDGYYTEWSIIEDCEQVCDPEVELVVNGGFEAPVVTNEKNWNIFDSTLTSWETSWLPVIQSTYSPTLELQRGVNNWVAYAGEQYAELDGDWDGPDGTINGEQASTRIYQDIETIPGETYTVSFAFSPRPDTDASNNNLEFSWNGIVEDNISRAGSGDVDWSEHTYQFVADLAVTRLQFADAGTSDSLGTFIDDVSVRCGVNPVCGNGIKEGDEECDGEDGITEGYYCTELCVLEEEQICVDPGTIVINEIMQNPSAVGDSDGEWFEVYNTTEEDINLENCVISDSGANTHTISSSLVIPALGYAVLGNNGDMGSNGGVSLDYEYPGSYALGNTDDEVIITCCETEIDRVEYDGGPSFPNPIGKSMILDDPNLDNNVGDNWCVSQSIYGNGDKGTPGYQNDPCEEICDASISGMKINGITQEAMSGWTIELRDPTGGLISSLVTDGDGYYIFEDLCIGTYYVDEINQEGWAQVSPLEPYEAIINCSGQDVYDRNFYNEPAFGSLKVCKMKDADGTLDEIVDQSPVSNWTFTIIKYQFDQTKQTGDDGCVIFDDLYPGDYLVTENPMPDHWTAIDPESGEKIVEVIAGSQTETVFYNYEGGNYGSICGYKYEDEDGNIQTPNTTGLEGWEIVLNGMSSCEAGEEWSDSVVSYTAGSPVIIERSDSSKSLGAAQYDDTINFVSLGFGGELVLEFDNYIINGPGGDVSVVETSYGGVDCNA